MKQPQKNILQALAQQAPNAGGISQAQQELNDGYEQLALLLATCLVFGFGAQLVDDQKALFEEVKVGAGHIIAGVQQALLENKGAAVGDLLRALAPNMGENAPNEQEG